MSDEPIPQEWELYWQRRESRARQVFAEKAKRLRDAPRAGSAATGPNGSVSSSILLQGTTP